MKIRIPKKDHSRLVELCKYHGLGVGEAVRILLRQFDCEHAVAHFKNRNMLQKNLGWNDVATFENSKLATSTESVVATIDGVDRAPEYVRRAIAWGIIQPRNQERKPKRPIEAEGVIGVDCVMAEDI